MKERTLDGVRSQAELRVGDRRPGGGVSLSEKEGTSLRGVLGGGNIWRGTSGAEDDKPGGYNENPRDKGL